MRIVTLSDLHIGKWGDYGKDLFESAEKDSAEVLWLNGDIFEPDADPLPDVEDYLKRAGKLHSQYDHVVWVAGNNDLELDILKGPVTNYAEEFGSVLESFGIHLLDRSPLVTGDIVLVGNIGWSNGGLWEPSIASSEWPNSPDVNKKYTETFFQKLFGDRWDITSPLFFQQVQSNLAAHVEATKDKRVVLGTHYVTSKKLVLYGDRPKYDYLNWYMGFEADELYKVAEPELALVGHTHRNQTVMVGSTMVHNISGVKELTSFQI